jgi:hypothetical protein
MHPQGIFIRFVGENNGTRRGGSDNLGISQVGCKIEHDKEEQKYGEEDGGDFEFGH